MDPTVTLEAARAAAREVWVQVGKVDVTAVDDPIVNAATELAEAFEALDKWVSMGGHLPADWQEVK